jgi:hypothetical protein
MVGQHDAAGTDADALCATRHVADQHGGGRAGDARHVVVFGQPVAAVAQRIGVLGQFQHVGEGGGGVTALADRGQVKDRQRDHQAVFRHRIPHAWGRPAPRPVTVAGC